MSTFFPSGGCLYSKVRGSGSFKLSPAISSPASGSNQPTILIQGAQVSVAARLYDLQTLGGKTFYYAFGNAPADVEIPILVLLGKVGSSAGDRAYQALFQYFANNSPAARPGGVTISMPGASSLRVLLVGFSISPPDPIFNRASGQILARQIKPKS